MDAAGKDGTIRHVMSGVNPQGVSVHSFKVPSARSSTTTSCGATRRRRRERGSIGIFNRSHYEEVLVVRVHPEILEASSCRAGARGRDIWKRRYREINDWEHYLVENGFRVVKLFLNLSKEEQRRRFLARIDEPEKNWKFSAADVPRSGATGTTTRRLSPRCFSHTSTEWAPWYVIPADRKWFARVAAAAVIANALIDIDPQYPTVSKEQRDMLQGMRAQLGGPDTGDGHHADTSPAGAAEAVAVNDKKKS